MTQDTNPNRYTVTAPAAVRIIGRNLASMADQVRAIEPDEMSRPDLLGLLATIAAGLDLSAALLDHNADRLNAEAVARADMLDQAEPPVRPMSYPAGGGGGANEPNMLRDLAERGDGWES
jgi:hypothetical protein